MAYLMMKALCEGKMEAEEAEEADEMGEKVDGGGRGGGCDISRCIETE